VVFERIKDSVRLRQLLEAVLFIESDLSMPSVLYRIIEQAKNLAGAKYAAMGVLDEEGKRLAEFLTVGLDEDTVRAIGAPPEGRGVLGQLIVDPRPIRLEDVTTHPFSWGFPPNHPIMHSFLGVPILVSNKVFGNLYLAEKQGERSFSEEDEAVVQALATAAGIAIDSANLHKRISELTLIEDRERIARDLHDTVIQRLFATGLSLQGIVKRIEDATVSKRLQDAVDELDDVIRQIRSTIFALGHEMDTGQGVRHALAEMVRDSAKALGFEPSLEVDGPLDSVISPGQREHLLTTVREALSNVARHARATAVKVVVTVGEEIVLEVEDNGVGFDVAEVRSCSGRGLANMSERAKLLGGHCSIDNRPSGGTVLTWVVPLKAPSRLDDPGDSGS
jgi:signal transduction histidine kinase